MSGIFEVTVHPASKKPDIWRKLGKILTHYGTEGADGCKFQFVRLNRHDGI
jgi:hypothetical protein